MRLTHLKIGVRLALAFGAVLCLLSMLATVAVMRTDGLREDVVSLRTKLESGSDVEAIRNAYQKLESTTFSIAESLYGAPEGGEPPPA